MRRTTLGGIAANQSGLFQALLFDSTKTPLPDFERARLSNGDGAAAAVLKQLCPHITTWELAEIVSVFPESKP